jgi:hypothetical protein
MSPAEPQGSVLGPLHYTLFTADITQQHSTVTSTHADGTAMMSRHENINRATTDLQIQLDSTANWTGKWRLKLNESKSTRVTFTLLQFRPDLLPGQLTRRQPPIAFCWTTAVNWTGTPHCRQIQLVLVSEWWWVVD